MSNNNDCFQSTKQPGLVSGLLFIEEEMEETTLAVKLRDGYHYDPETGLFTITTDRGRWKRGKAITAKDSCGYIVIDIEGKRYMAHRLAFLYMTSKWPTNDVDHKDTDRSNNRWANLRDVTKSTNSRNKSVQKNNTSGTVGVSWNIRRSRWQARIYVNGKQIALGDFVHKEDAIFARMTAEKDYGYWVDKVWDQL